MSFEKLLPELEGNVEKRKSNKYVLMLHNDNFNEFEHVMDSLVEVCQHTSEQAEQCTLLAHLRGKCDIKHGEYSRLEPMCDALLIRGITATIED